LISTSSNSTPAKALALRGLECSVDNRKNDGEVNSHVIGDIKTIAADVTRAWHTKSQGDMDKLSGGKYASDSLNFPDDVRAVKETQVCAAWGNERIAFVNTLSCFDGTHTIGHKSLTVVLKKEEGAWRLRLISDAGNIVDKLYERTSRLSGVRPAARIDPAVVLAPPDGAKFDDRFNGRPMLEWMSSGVDDIIYLVEWQFEGVGWSGSGFDVIPADQTRDEKITVRAPFGVGAQPHRWRVWAIDGIGESYITNWRRIVYTR
jgi:hypothetical protein